MPLKRTYACCVEESEKEKCKKKAAGRPRKRVVQRARKGDRILMNQVRKSSKKATFQNHDPPKMNCGKRKSSFKLGSMSVFNSKGDAQTHLGLSTVRKNPDPKGKKEKKEGRFLETLKEMPDVRRKGGGGRKEQGQRGDGMSVEA